MPSIDIPFSFIIALVNGTDDNDDEVFHYVAIKEEKIEDYLTAVKLDSPYDLADYGIIIESGYGTPDSELKDKMQRLYGCNHDSMMKL